MPPRRRRIIPPGLPDPLNPNNYPPKDDEFIQVQKEMGDKFAYFRTYGIGKDGWNPAKRQKAIAQRIQPSLEARKANFRMGEAYPDTTDARYMRELEKRVRRVQRKKLRPGRRRPIASMDPDKLQNTDFAINRPTVRARLGRARMRFVKVLGWVSRDHHDMDVGLDRSAKSRRANAGRQRYGHYVELCAGKIRSEYSSPETNPA